MSDEHKSALWYSTDDDGVHLRCLNDDCDFDINLGFDPTVNEVQRVWDWHVPLVWPWSYTHSAYDCPNAPHRGPEGPNEDTGQCGFCGTMSFAMRPWGETFGYHLEDCSLPVDHESYCKPGGSGHPPARKIRG